MLLADIRDIFNVRNTDRLASNQLVEALTAMEERPWPELVRGKPMTATQLARKLKPFGVKSSKWKEYSATQRGYLLEEFADVFSRYLPPLRPPPPPPGGNDSGFPISTRHPSATQPPPSPPEAPPERPQVAAVAGSNRAITQRLLDEAIARNDGGCPVGCIGAMKANQPALWARIMDCQDAVDEAVVAGDIAATTKALGPFEDAWAEAKVWYRLWVDAA